MKIIILVTFLLLISNCQCGLIDGVFGMVTNTTHDIAHNVGGILSLGRQHVFGENKNGSPAEAGVVQHTKGLLGGLFDSIHDNARNFEERIKNLFHNKPTTDNGVLGNTMDRIKNRVVNIKRFLFGNNDKTQDTHTVHRPKPMEIINKTHDNVIDKTKPTRDFLNRLLFGKDNIKNMHYNDIVKALEDMEKKYSNIHHNAKPGIKNPHTEEKPDDGAGLIDVRSSFVDVKEGTQKFMKEKNTRNVRVPYDTSDVSKQVNKLKSTIDTSINDIESDVNSFK